jgi:hypothetical protein
MTSYIRRPYPAKKHDNLNRREAALLHSLQDKCSEDKLRHAAEDVRQAYLGVQKALIYYARDAGNIEDIDADQIKKAEAEISDWKALSTDQIIEKYKRQAQQGAAANP